MFHIKQKLPNNSVIAKIGSRFTKFGQTLLILFSIFQKCSMHITHNCFNSHHFLPFVHDSNRLYEEKAAEGMEWVWDMWVMLLGCDLFIDILYLFYNLFIFVYY